MQELSLLSKKCLVNMPMMLDAITVTIDDMKKLLSSNYEDVIVRENSIENRNDGRGLPGDRSRRVGMFTGFRLRACGHGRGPSCARGRRT